MYCFPYPKGSNIAPIRVPCVATATYSLAGSKNFSKGFADALEAESKRSSESDGSSSKLVIQSTAQSYIFFGIASEALGRTVRPDELTETSPDTLHPFIDLRIPRWYSTALKSRWGTLAGTLSKEDYAQAKKRFLEHFQAAQLLVVFLDLQADDDDDELALVLLSVNMLLYLIAERFCSEKIMQTSMESHPTKVLMKRMVENGWCRKRLNILDVVPMFYPTIYYLSSIRLLRVRNEDHRMCDGKQCHVRGELLQPLHRTAECLCEDIHVPLDEVCRIVAAGGIPLIRICRTESAKIELSVVPYQRTVHFTAISHVWADRQLGSTNNSLPMCQVEHLDSVLASLPRQVSHWRFQDWLPSTGSSAAPAGGIAPPSRTYELFWLDTFCIPQADKHADLRSKAIESMNLIYAAAAQTVVFDAALQNFDGGRRPAALSHGGKPTFYSPANESLLDVLAQLYASSWMGRAWTLQEGVLSDMLLFPLDGSIAYLKLLWPSFDDGILSELRSSIQHVWNSILKQCLVQLQRSNPAEAYPVVVDGESEPFRERLRQELFAVTKSMLNVDDYRNYARGSAERAARFNKFHSLLQSRSTTQAQDLPLILVNMSGMNGNSVAQWKDTNERMKLLFYGLGHLPLELLFSNCARIGRCEVDAWIPREIVPEHFSENLTLKLESSGWTFNQRKEKPLGFFLLPQSASWENEVLLYVRDENNTQTKYRVETLLPTHKQPQQVSKYGWCILVDDTNLKTRGARFMITRMTEKVAFLHFDCPLLLHRADTKTSEQLIKDVSIALPASDQQHFIILKSDTPQTLGMPRPQNSEQYSDRLIVISQAVYWTMGWLQTKILKYLISKSISENTVFLIALTVLNYKQLVWIEGGIQAFVHHAWVETFKPTWSSSGPWRYFWKLSNFVPPVPFKTLNKWFCQFVFFLSVMGSQWNGMVQITLYWLLIYPTKELLNMYLTALAWHCLARYLGR